MKIIFIFLICTFTTNCSLNKDSQFWIDESVKREDGQQELSLILKKSEDSTNMTFKEYEIYIDDYTKNSKFPDISQ